MYVDLRLFNETRQVQHKTVTSTLTVQLHDDRQVYTLIIYWMHYNSYGDFRVSISDSLAASMSVRYFVTVHSLSFI